MSPFLRCALAAVVLAGPTGVWAGDVSTLQGAVEEAVVRNPEVLERYHIFTAASEEVGVARGGLLPHLDVDGHIGSETLVQDHSVPPTRRDTYNVGGGDITLRQLLFDGMATPREVKRLKYARRVRYYELLATAEDSALQTTKAYLDVIRYRKLVALASDNYANHKEVFEHVRQRVEAGIGRGVDLEQAGARLALAETNLITETANLHDVSARFQRLVGVDPPTPLQDPPALDGKLPPADELKEGGWRAAPQMNAALENIRAARYELKSKYGPYWPTLALQGSINGERNVDNLIDREYRGRLELMMNWNIFSGGSDHARIRQYREKLYEAYDTRDKTCRDIRQNVRIAWNDTRKLHDQLVLQDERQLSTAKARDAYRQQFDLGQRTLLDLLDTENELYDARRTYKNSEADYQLAFARVLAPSGYLVKALGLRTVGSEAVDDGDDPIGDGDRVYCTLEDPSIYQVTKPADRPVTPLPKRRRLESFTLKADTLFAFDKADLSERGKQSLDGLVDGLMAHAKHKDRIINVHGYTDRLGGVEYNQRLSERRAATVRQYLIGKGLPFAQVTAQGHGENDPVTGTTCVGTKKTAALIDCLQPDRRVVIDVEGQEEITIQYDPDAHKWERADTPPAGAPAPAPAPAPAQ
ncbi:MAG TPA: TolC family outer membrane protein [Moraxellaceae bacterium]|nr:TolC family outer membrane protein [Moraxellaceae bacterium]